jgi:hypothetical protein
MNNNILRTAKVKTRIQITQACEHNFRLRDQANIDTSKSHLNQVLVNSLGVDTTKANDLQLKLSQHYQALGIKEKSDNVLMMEFVVSASPDFFLKKTKAEIDDWAKSQVNFFDRKFGKQVKLAVLHLDEKTPHLHFLIGTEFNSVKKYKNQKGEFFKETWSLNAKRYDKKFLIDLHTEHANHNNKYGLKRGVKGSMRKHSTLKEFYKMVDKAVSADYQKQIQKTIDTLETGLLSGKVAIEEVREKFAPMINSVLKQNKALREKFAFDIKELANKLSKKEDELEVKEAELIEKEEVLKSRREVYSQAINKAMNDAKIIKEQQEEIALLKGEVNKYKPLPVSESLHNGNKRTGINSKLTPKL